MFLPNFLKLPFLSLLFLKATSCFYNTISSSLFFFLGFCLNPSSFSFQLIPVLSQLSNSGIFLRKADGKVFQYLWRQCCTLGIILERKRLTDWRETNLYWALSMCEHYAWYFISTIPFNPGNTCMDRLDSLIDPVIQIGDWVLEEMKEILKFSHAGNHFATYKCIKSTHCAP